MNCSFQPYLISFWFMVTTLLQHEIALSYICYIARMFGNESSVILEMECAAPEGYQPLILCSRRLKRSFWGNIQALCCACAVSRSFCRLAANPEFLGCGLLCTPKSCKELYFWEFVWPYRDLPETGDSTPFNDSILFRSCHRTSCNQPSLIIGM